MIKAPPSLPCPLEIVNPSGIPRRGEPVTIGVPWPRGVCHEPEELVLLTPTGQALPRQVSTLDRWSDGSIRWLLVDFQATSSSSLEHLRLVQESAAVTPSGGIRVQETANQIVMDTGPATFVLGGGRGFPFDSVTVAGQHLIADGDARLDLELDTGPVACRFGPPAIEEHGSLRSTIRIDATALGPRGRSLELVTRLRFFAGSSVVRMDVTLRNPRRARHPGGYWELGDPGSVLIRNLACSLAIAGRDDRSQVIGSIEGGETLSAFEQPFLLHQDSSGGERWNSHVHVNRHGTVPMAFRGYRLSSGRLAREGLRATPVVAVRTATAQIAVTMEHFWENCPKTIDVQGGTLTVGLFPSQHGDLHELQGGEQKTHTLWLAFGEDNVTEVSLDWCRQPLVVRSTPEWYAAAQAAPYLTPAASDPHRAYVELVDAAINGPDSFFAKRELADEYGWRHFGDIYADHENAFAPPPHPVVSHYNNQYDAIAGFAYQFFRSGNLRWWKLLRELAHHVVDIDIYHTSEDKSAYNGGMFWHTAHYVDGGRSTHRTYPRAAGVSGGGPSAEHNYSTGLMLHYFLTGDPAFREAVIGLAEWVLGMEDGSRTVFRWLARDDTGAASATGSPDYHGPGRAPANSIQALLNAYRLTHNIVFLAKAEQLIRRCIHPDDDLAERRLLDAERRWYYTVFLQAIGGYLDLKDGEGDRGDMYAYARASLIHYARWMSAHEYPYLDKPEILEYPTETWAAQDMRKCEVLQLAARHVDGGLRAQFLERAGSFFHASVNRLQASSTRSLARPLVLLLSNGFSRAWFLREPLPAAPPMRPRQAAAFPQPELFVPQRARAKRNLVRAAWALFATGGAVVIGWLATLKS